MKTIVIILTIVACAAIEREELYTTLVHMTLNPIGHDNNNKCGQDELLNYLREAFGFDENIHQKALENARNMEVPTVHLAVEVVEAEALFAKDSNGLSDPFCIIYLGSTNEQLCKTKVVEKTTAPVWKEKFEREFEHVENDTLRLEVWDFDAAETRSEVWSRKGEAMGVRGTIKLIKEFVTAGTSPNGTVEFIGSSEIALKEIPVTGQTEWFVLIKKKKPRGIVQLKLAFATSNNPQEVIEEYRELLRILLYHAIETEKVEDYCWLGISSPVARAIDLQYRVHRGLLDENVALSQWTVYSNINKEHPLHYTVFENLAGELLGPFADLVSSSAERTLFWDGAKNVLYTSFKFIKDIHELKKCNRPNSPHLQGILGLMSLISGIKVPEEFDLFPTTLYDWLPDQDSTKMTLPQVFKYTVEEGITKWWDLLPSENVTETNADQAAIEYRIDITKRVIGKLQKTFETHDKAFIRQGDFPHAETAFIAHAKRLSDLCMRTIEDVCLKLERLNGDNKPNDIVLGETVYTLYRIIKHFVEYGQNLGIDGTAEITILSYHKWFKAGALYWLELSRFRALERINKAIEHDSLTSAVASDYSRISSSAVDVIGIFEQMLTFWDRSAWPDIREALLFLEIIIKDACTSSNVYANNLLARFKNVPPESDKKGDASSGTDEETFQVSRAWCFAISDIEHVQTAIGPWANHSVPRGFLNELGPEADDFLQSLAILINVAINELERKIVNSFEVVGNEAVKSIAKCVMLIAKSSDQNGYENAMLRLENYLLDNITILRESLSNDNFSKIAAIIWQIVLQMLNQQVRENLKKNRPISFYSKLLDTVKYLDRGFRKLGIDEIPANVEMYEEIERLLEFNAMETTELIRRYNIDRIRDQDNLTEPIEGIISVLTQFIGTSLNIQKLKAEHLRVMDSDGSSDPYVKIKLLPNEKFHNVKMPTTRVRKNTINPAFDETFNIPLSREHRNWENAILVFEVWDQDLCGLNRFMAEAFLQLSKIPQNGIDKVETVMMNLSRPSNETEIVVETLENRKKDKKAMKFITSRQKKILSH